MEIQVRLLQGPCLARRVSHEQSYVLGFLGIAEGVAAVPPYSPYGPYDFCSKM